MRQYRCKKCGLLIGYKKWGHEPRWLGMAIPKRKMCDRCVLEDMKKRGEDTSFFEKTLYVAPFQGILDEISEKSGDRPKDR